jgi:hypothetical protein
MSDQQTALTTRSIDTPSGRALDGRYDSWSKTARGIGGGANLLP